LLLQRRITGYLYNIKTDADYQEHTFADDAAEALLLEEQQLEWTAAQHLHHIQQQRRQQLASAVPVDRQQLHGSGQLPRQQQQQQQQPRVQLRSEAGYTW
jgi:hypothetical protein